ncbi:hypothetical protein ACP70R_017605 [Stipagrostis hirtigluma subsp. patula]
MGGGAGLRMGRRRRRGPAAGVRGCARRFMAYGSFLIMSAAGATYIFAIYSKDIKFTLVYTQEQLNTVDFFKDVGANVGIHAGLFDKVTPTWLVLAVGAAMNLGGYLMLYLSVTEPVRRCRERRGGPVPGGASSGGAGRGGGRTTGTSRWAGR